MGMIVKDYLTHTSVQFLFLALFASLAAISGIVCLGTLAVACLVVVSALFYEWVTHKFVLHGALSLPVPGRWRDYQIRLHHGHHLDPADRALQFAPPALFNHDGTTLSVLCAGVLSITVHRCRWRVPSLIIYFFTSGFIWPIIAKAYRPAHAHGLSIARCTYAPSFSQ